MTTYATTTKNNHKNQKAFSFIFSFFRSVVEQEGVHHWEYSEPKLSRGSTSTRLYKDNMQSSRPYEGKKYNHKTEDLTGGGQEGRPTIS